MIPTIVCGVAGRMGSRLVDLIRSSSKLSLLAGVEAPGSFAIGTHIGDAPVVDDLAKVLDRGQVVIDFSHHEATVHHVQLARDHKKPIVIGTTGLDEKEIKEIHAASQAIPVCFSPNMSVGVNALFKLIAEAARILGKDYDVEVVEAHHRLKKDAPSGTAMKIAEVLTAALNRNLKKDLRFHREGMVGERRPEEIGIQSVRGGDIVGDHTVLFAGPGERLEITHRATNRDNFARGALLAAEWIVGKKPGLYDMQDVLGLK